jgi:hypothetical protein
MDFGGVGGNLVREFAAMLVIFAVQLFSVGADKETRWNRKSILRANRPAM